MLSRKSSGVIDLRGGRSPKKTPRGQVPLFSPRIPELPRRPMPLRARRRRVRALIVLGILVLCGGVVYAVSWISYLPQFNISGISVVGAQDIREELITRSLETVLDDGAYRILSRRNIFLYPRTSLEEIISESFPPVKSVRISRPSLLATDLVVTIEEREPFARWCEEEGEQCYFLDDGGFIYAPVGDTAGTTTARTIPRAQYIFSGGLTAPKGAASSTEPIGQWFVQAHLPGLLSLLTYLGQAGFTVVSAQVEGQDIFIRLQEGFLVKASFGADAGTLVKNLELVLSSDILKGKTEELEYVDLRFGNRVYYKLRGQEQQSAQ